ncbi:hypothetical protein GCM10010271_56390 [Streptomyces kurssanovii]|nr:hypothetical protein GCM10010271_56390 [Streptomyces kurssanovii]
MAFSRRLWDTYHSRGCPAGSGFLLGGVRGFVVSVATAIGNLLARWRDHPELLFILPAGTDNFPWPDGV